MLRIISKTHSSKFGFASNDLNADNGAMIAFVAERMLERGVHKPIGECDIEQRYRIDRAVVYQ